MGSFNVIELELTCPRCNTQGYFAVNAYFGKRNFTFYKLGDEYQWIPRKAIQNGGRPEAGSMIGPGYFICAVCDKDSHMVVVIENDKIKDVGVDTSQSPFTPD